MKQFLHIVWLVFLITVVASAARAADMGGAGYAGADACLGCHDNQAKLMSKSPHWKKAVPGNPYNGRAARPATAPAPTMRRREAARAWAG